MSEIPPTSREWSIRAHISFRPTADKVAPNINVETTKPTFKEDGRRKSVHECRLQYVDGGISISTDCGRQVRMECSWKSDVNEQRNISIVNRPSSEGVACSQESRPKNSVSDSLHIPLKDYTFQRGNLSFSTAMPKTPLGRSNYQEPLAARTNWPVRNIQCHTVQNSRELGHNEQWLSTMPERRCKSVCNITLQSPTSENKSVTDSLLNFKRCINCGKKFYSPVRPFTPPKESDCDTCDECDGKASESSLSSSHSTSTGSDFYNRFGVPRTMPKIARRNNVAVKVPRKHEDYSMKSFLSTLTNDRVYHTGNDADVEISSSDTECETQSSQSTVFESNSFISKDNTIRRPRILDERKSQHLSSWGGSLRSLSSLGTCDESYLHSGSSSFGNFSEPESYSVDGGYSESSDAELSALFDETPSRSMTADSFDYEDIGDRARINARFGSCTGLKVNNNFVNGRLKIYPCDDTLGRRGYTAMQRHSPLSNKGSLVSESVRVTNRYSNISTLKGDVPLFSKNFNAGENEMSSIHKARMFGDTRPLKRPGHHTGPSKNPSCVCEYCVRECRRKARSTGDIAGVEYIVSSNDPEHVGGCSYSK